MNVHKCFDPVFKLKVVEFPGKILTGVLVVS